MMQKYHEKQRILAQSHLPNTALVTLLVPPRKQKALVATAVMTNLTGASVTVSLFASTANTSFVNSNALIYEKVLTTKEVLIYQFNFPLGVEYPGGVGAQSNTANAVTVTLLGCDAEGSANGI